MNDAFKKSLFVWLILYGLAVFIAWFSHPAAIYLAIVPVAFAIDTLAHRMAKRPGPPIGMRLLNRLFLLQRWCFWKLTGGRPGHRPQDGEPQGFCPKCGYAISPGRCPECGTQVSAETLSSRPGQRNPFAYRIAWICVVAVFAMIGLVTGHRMLPWPSMAPLSLLLYLHGWSDSRAAAELISRVTSGNLTNEEERRVCERSLRASIKLQPPFPNDGRIAVTVIPETALAPLLANMWIYLRDIQITKSGTPVDHTPSEHITTANQDHALFLVEPLGAGKHLLNVTGRMLVTPAKHSGDADTAAYCKIPFSASIPVTVDRQDASTFYSAVTGDLVLSDINTNIVIALAQRLSIEKSGEEKMAPCLVIQNGSRDALPVSGQVFVRRSKADAYQFVDRTIVNSAEMQLIDLSSIDWASRARTLDIRIEPDPTIMSARRYATRMDYIGEIIEREKIPRSPIVFQ
ncbi:MAG: zinc ribbon domain-containing protein [Phycisphaerae bacterium]|nr:zinc ribbon domain-containing protein [Phycisphaerae bacterium]